jgi:FkbM family methyltransferase
MGVKRKWKSIINGSWQKLRFQLSASNAWVFSWYYAYFYQPKPGTLSAFLHAYSGKKSPFTVIQIGANDGISHDLIHKFIKRDHWQGVLLEPQQAVFNRLRTLYQKDKGIIPVNAALGHEDGQTELYKIGFSAARWATGLASFNKSVLENAFASGYVQKKADEEGVAIPEDSNKQIITEHIQVISPVSLMKLGNIQQYDLLQIDTEGFDYEVIKIFSGQSVLPNAVIYENAHLSATDQAACLSMLQTKGFICRDFGKDTLAIREHLAPVYGLR